MQKKTSFLILLFSVIFLLSLIPNSKGIIIMSESYEFSGLRGYTMHSVSSNPVKHQIKSVNNVSITIYVLERALNMSDVASEPADFVHTYSGSEIDEIFTLSASAVSIIIYSENPVDGSITWDHNIGFPDQGMNTLTYVILITITGVGLFIVYRIYRWRKLKE